MKLKEILKAASDDLLDDLFHSTIEEMNRRKEAKPDTVDVGFWNAEGVYVEDIQPVDELEEWIKQKDKE